MRPLSVQLDDITTKNHKLEIHCFHNKVFAKEFNAIQNKCLNKILVQIKRTTFFHRINNQLKQYEF